MTAPLSGIRVVEIASFVAVPAAGALLADLGAEVVKVEVPGGETLRHALPRRLGYRHGMSEAPHFHMDNRGKRSLALDLARPAARAALRRVIARADVVLTNLLPRRLAKFGLDAATLRAAHPRLVFASLSGYGARGPDADTPAFDYTAYWARSGLMDVMRDVGAGPAFLRPGVGDHAAALALASGILAALRVRDRDGVGQEVDVDLLHTGLYVAGNDAAVVASTDLDTPRHDPARPRNPLWSHYRTADARFLFLVMIDSQRYWPALCRALDFPELERDERFRDEVARYRNAEELVARIASVVGARDLAHWERHLASFPLIWAPVRTLREAMRDPQVAAMGMLADVALPDPDAAGLRTVAPPLQLSRHAMPGTAPAPALGADGEAVLREAGCSDAEVEAALGPADGAQTPGSR
ncbi:MAG: CoA transferase [Myxococcales bacterium]|nr:CoA transferase [Myxococcales bacterium]